MGAPKAELIPAAAPQATKSRFSRIITPKSENLLKLVSVPNMLVRPCEMDAATVLEPAAGCHTKGDATTLHTNVLRLIKRGQCHSNKHLLLEYLSLLRLGSVETKMDAIAAKSVS